MNDYDKPSAPLLPNVPPAQNPHYAPQGFTEHYQPAPPAYSQQHPPQPTPGYYGAPAPSSSTTTNVVVVNQPATRPTPIVAPMAPRAPDYFNFSVCTLVFCILCGGIPFVICAIVALVFSIKAQDHNKSGDYEAARSSGRFALIFNIVAFVSGPIIYGIIILSVIIYSATANAAAANAAVASANNYN